jgi:cystathionine beta-lyase
VNPFAVPDLRARRSATWAEYGPDVLPMWAAEMDVVLAEPIRAALAEMVARSDTGYAHPGRLGEAFACFAAARWGWTVEPAHTMLVPDVMRGIAEALRVLTPDGAAVVVDSPAYPPFFHWIPDSGRRCVTVPHADLGRLERAFADGAAAYLLCNPHDPTGTVRTRAELEAIAELATRYDVQVVVDEIHAPLVYDGAHVPFATLDSPAARRAVVLASASKAWNLAGLEAALLVAGPGAWPVVRRIPEEVRYGAGLPGVLASEAAWLHGVPWLDAVLAGLDARRRLLADLLAAEVPAVRYTPPAATYLAWLDFRGVPGLGDDPAAVLLARGRVALSAGPTFGAEGRGFAGLNLGTSERTLRAGVRRIALGVGPE